MHDPAEDIERDSDALLSEPALADWSREEEDAAWAHLQQPQSPLDPSSDNANDG